MIRRWDVTDRERPVCKAGMRKREMQKRREERQGRAEACVIVLPRSFDPGCGSCCYLEHLYLIRGKWVVREKEKKREKLFPASFFLCSLFYIFVFIPACVISLLLFLDLNALHPHYILPSLESTVY